MSIDEQAFSSFLQLSEEAGINTVEELCNKTSDDMMRKYVTWT